MNILQKQADTIRFLCADMVQKASSGHPGAPMGLADIVTVLSSHLVHNPKNPKWLNRDRVVFSGGHASALVYSFLHLSGYDISLEDLKNFRQLDSKTPGHPEYGEVCGVEVTTGPLGQGVANAVGFAMASKYAANLLNEDEIKPINHMVYCLCGDGDLQEGISYEACSLAGTLGLDNLVLIYDSNHITIEGDTAIAWHENVKERFEAQGWIVARINGHDYEEINLVLQTSRQKDKPFLIIADTVIAKGACALEGSHKSHGAPLGEDEIREAKIKAGFDPEKHFFIDEDVRLRFSSAVEKGELAELKWHEELKKLSPKKQELLDNLLHPDFSKIEYPSFQSGTSVATRDSNGQILNAIAKALPSFIGGSADLGPSNKTELKGFSDFPHGKNIHFGIREHSMAAITNAIALYGLFVPYCATFFIFSDYLKPSARLAALMRLKNFFIFTHDSIGVGEDGPTHQPIEQLSTFRAMPGFNLFRPADANENVECWRLALSLNSPAAFVCSRQGLRVLEDEKAYGEVANGGYLLKSSINAKLTLIASGSEIELAMKSAQKLESEGIGVNIVSVPCFDILNKQTQAYKAKIFDKNTKILAIEAGSGIEWYRYCDEVLCMESFGASANANDLFVKFGFSVENVCKKAKELLAHA